MIEASVILDSIGEHSPRLTTFLVVFPAFVEQELLRHRSFSFSSSSSRAVPVSKMLEEVRSDELRAAPVWWGREQKGMASGDELSDEPITNWPYPKDEYPPKSERQLAKDQWASAANTAASIAHTLMLRGVHKSIVNRILAPFIHRRIVITTCEPGLMNFFGLRLDKGAQPEIRALAEKMWAAWKASEPRLLRPGEWHLPFISENGGPKGGLDAFLKVSVARCARTSYLSFDTGRRSTVEEDLRLYDKLAGGPIIHASPMEHQAMPDEWIESWHDNYGPDMAFRYREQHGNLPGWRQFRKMIPGEAVAPLPEGYR